LHEKRPSMIFSDFSYGETKGPVVTGDAGEFQRGRPKCPG
jgi:hypothetical protein